MRIHAYALLSILVSAVVALPQAAGPQLPADLATTAAPADAFVTTVLRDGSLALDGKAVSLTAWREQIQRAADAQRAPAVPGRPNVSELNAVFAVDKHTPVGVVGLLLTELVRPGCGVYRVHFSATNHAGDLGVIEWFVPIDGGVGAARRPAAPPAAPLLLRAAAAAGDAAQPTAPRPTDITAETRRYVAGLAPQAQASAAVVLDGAGDLAFGPFVGAVAAARQGGVSQVMFAAAPTPAQLNAWLREMNLEAVVRAADTVTALRFATVAGGPAVFPTGGSGQQVFTNRSGPPLRRQRGSRQALEPAVLEAVTIGAEWLANQQHPQGHWGGQVHTTSAALLALMADGSTLRSGRHKAAIKRGINWLRALQDDTGTFGEHDRDPLHSHALATTAMMEAHILSQYKLIRKCAATGVGQLVALAGAEGGWGDGRCDESDVVATAWAALACATATWSEDPPRTDALVAAQRWLGARAEASGRYSYGPADYAPRIDAVQLGRFPPEHVELATAAGMVAHQFLSTSGPWDRAAMVRSAAILLRRPPQWNTAVGTVDEVYWLLASAALHQLGGDSWTQWRAHCVHSILPEQRQTGADAGSWNPESAWADAGGREWTTAMMLLILETPRRHGRFVE